MITRTEARTTTDAGMPGSNTARIYSPRPGTSSSS